MKYLQIVFKIFDNLQIWTAQKMIQQIGVTLPELPPERHLTEITKKKVCKFLILSNSSLAVNLVFPLLLVYPSLVRPCL